MKRWVILMFFCLGVVQAQENEEESGIINLYVEAPFFVGNNLTADSHGKTGIGFAAELIVVEYKRFGFTLLYGISGYQVTDTRLLGNFKKSYANEFGLGLYYKSVLAEKQMLRYQIGTGKIFMQDKNKEKNIKSLNEGYKLYAGAEYEYKISDKLRLLLGLQYDFINFDVSRDMPDRSYFAKANRLQARLGLGF